MNTFFMPRKVRFLIDRMAQPCLPCSRQQHKTSQGSLHLLANLQEENGTIAFRSIIPSGINTSSGSNTDTGITNYPTPFVHPPTETGPFVEALVFKAPPGTILLGTSDPMQHNDHVQLWGQLQGVKTAMQPVSSDQAVNL